jgi:hypothetical protein
MAASVLGRPVIFRCGVVVDPLAVLKFSDRDGEVATFVVDDGSGPRPVYLSDCTVEDDGSVTYDDGVTTWRFVVGA